MSAFDRLPKDYRKLCHALAKAWSSARQNISPKNRRVRFAADLMLARAKTFPNTITRQQRRWRQRSGLASAA